MTFARDARELLIECCVEFITLISSEANEIAEKEQKKTIAIEHIDRALRDLGFPEYVRAVLDSAGDAKEMLKVSGDLYLWILEREMNGMWLMSVCAVVDERKEDNEDGAEWTDAGGVDGTAGCAV